MEKSIYIKFSDMENYKKLCNLAATVDGEVAIKKGRWEVDARSLMGILSIDFSNGATVLYPAEGAEELENFLKEYEV